MIKFTGNFYEHNWAQNVADPHQSDADPDPAFTLMRKPDPNTHFFPDLDHKMLQNDPLRIPPFHFDPDLAFYFDADAHPASKNNADPGPQHWLAGLFCM